MSLGTPENSAVSLGTPENSAIQNLSIVIIIIVKVSADVPCLQEILTFVRFVAILCQFSWFSCRSGPWRQSATCGLLLSILFWGSNLLLQCGNVEPNPGPPKAHTMRQTIRHDETDN